MSDVAAYDDIAEDQRPKEPKSSRPWLAMITTAEKEFRSYQDKADNIDKQYANLERLANNARDRQFQMFWANIAVLGPSIYSRPPVPVVVPRFKDRRPIYRTASELLERAAVVGFEMEDIDAVMMLVRDDLNVVARGAVWCRYDTVKYDGERVCVEHVDREDFLHDPARKWKEVDWVARRSWLTRDQARKRFRKYSSDAYKDLAYEKRKEEDGTDDGRLKAAVWEIWSRSKNKVVWVGEGSEKVLDENEPHLKLEGYFPCPRPAFGTTQRGTLIPVPDMVYYKDQLEEINDLTDRISSLAEAVKIKGFYPSGAGEISDAIEAAMKSNDNRVYLVGVANWAMFGGGSPKDSIVWLPIADVVNAIAQLIEVRKQVIEDVYQIMGLSDIMRGSTEADETLGAQQLKSQYGSVRIRDKQNELVRIARDVTRIMAEIMAENFEKETLLEMTQMELPTDAQIKKRVEDIKRQALGIQKEMAEAKSDPQLVAAAQQNPEEAKKILGQAQQQLQQLQQQAEKASETVTIDQVMKLLRDQRLRPYTLDIETDSTIAPDENAQKERATEFVTAVGGFMAQALPLVEQVPQAATLAAETLKFVASQFRAGRQLDQVIDEFADNMKDMASKPKPPSPEQQKAEADAKAAQAKQQTDMMNAQTESKRAEADAALKAQEVMERRAEEAHRAALRQIETDGKGQEFAIKQKNLMNDEARADAAHQRDMEIKALDLDKKRQEIAAIGVKTAATVATAESAMAVDQENAANNRAVTDATIQAKQDTTAAGIEAQREGLNIKREAAKNSGAPE